MASNTRHSYTLYIGSADRISWTRTRWQETSPNLYVKIKVEESAAQRTRVVKQNRTPAWNENVLVIGNTSSIISLSVKHSAPLFATDRCIGSIDISIETLLAQCVDGQSAILGLKLNASDERTSTTGEIAVKLNRVVDADSFIGVGRRLVHDLFELGVSQMTRFRRLGQQTDIDDCILNLRKAAHFAKRKPKPMCLTYLGLSQLRRYERLGGLDDLEDSISNMEKAVRLTKYERRNPNKSTYLSNLGLGLLKRYERLGTLNDLEGSIWNTEKALLKIPFIPFVGHLANKSVCLVNLGLCLLSRYERLGELTDLEDSISNMEKALRLIKDGHPDKATCLSNLSGSQKVRFERLRKMTDLEHSISNLHKAVQFTDDGHPMKAEYLSKLGATQQLRFKLLGELTDIEDCISNLQKAVQFSGEGDPAKPMRLSDLGLGQLRRYERLGGVTDVEDSISNLQKAVQLTDDGHHAKKSILLNNLALSQHGRYSHLGELTDLEHSISNFRETVQLTGDGHPSKPVCMSNLGVCQLSRYRLLGQLADMEDSISNLQQAVQFTQDGHLDAPMRLCYLGLSQQARFECFGELTDIQDSILNLQKAIQITEDGNPEKSFFYSNLGKIHLTRFKRMGEPAHLVASISAFRAAAQLKTAYPRHTLLAARHWADLSYQHGDILSALDGYRMALEILPKVAWLGLSTESRQNWLFREGSDNLSCLSATCAIQLGHFEEAVELLDLGRSVFWQQASSLRTDLEELNEAEPELAVQLERVGRMLDAGNFSEPLLHVDSDEQTIRGNSAEERRRLVGEWEGLLDRVRQLPEFEHFLKPVPFRQLRQAAAGGLVVIINASKYGVDALIFNATHQIEHVPLPNVDVEILVQLAEDILLRRPINASVTQRQGYNTRFLQPALRTVWNDIMIPIFNKIQVHSNVNSGTPKRRVWWYPTGVLTFIPLHAAGPGGGNPDVSCLVISSYVTTLSSLFQAQKDSKKGAEGRLKLLAVSQSDTPGHESLPLSMEEVDKVMQVVSSAGWPAEDIVCLNGSDATVDHVSRALDSSSWVHFACHGIQHPISGMSSAFALHNDHLELSQIASKRLTNGQFAFLSACHTAAGLQGLPGEAMHLAGALQFTGFPSVIATMWGIGDKQAPLVAEHCYQYLFRNGLQGCDPSDAATALNRAVLRLREDPNVTVDRWAPFIHFGI